MRLIKRLGNDELSGVVSKIVDSVLLETGYNFFERLEFSLGEDRVEVEDHTAKISLDKDNTFIVERDTRVTRILILQKLELAFLRKYNKFPDYIENLIVNRRIVKRFGNDFFYLSYIYLIREERNIKDMNKFLNINLPWLSFYGINDYNSRFLLKMLSMFKNRKVFQHLARKLFLALKRDLGKERNLAKAIKEFALLKEVYSIADTAV